VSTTLPYDYGGAKTAVERASRAQLDTEQQLRDAYKAYAAAERAYRQALAEEILKLRAGGTAITIAQDLARGEAHVSDLRYARDVADGVREAARQAAFRHAADRRELEQLIDWSRRVEAQAP
jgi:hypothetical protein